VPKHFPPYTSNFSKILQILLSVSAMGRFRIIQKNNTVMPILLAGTTEFFHIEQVSAFFKFRLGQVLLYYLSSGFTTGGLSSSAQLRVSELFRNEI
jgi:hypothetical protein